MMQFTADTISASGFHRLAWGEGAALTLGGRRGPSSHSDYFLKVCVEPRHHALHDIRKFRPSRFGSPGYECRRRHAHEHARETIRDAENSIRLHGKTIREEAHDFQC